MPTFERHTLDNGLRVLTASMPQAQSVSCFFMLAAGSRYETPETNGVAHFSEHMFFKGTERRPTARDISAEIDAIGGEFNAFTGKEYTAYYVRCATEYRDIALDVLVDMLRHATFDAGEIEREKGVILEEMNMYVDTPRDYISRVFDDLVYGESPLGWNILGTKETIQGATRETFLEYLGRWYKPERIVVGLAGNLGPSPVERIAELMGDMPAAESGLPAGSPFSVNGQVRVHEKVSDQAHLCVGVASYPVNHPDRYVLEILRTVLGGGMSSRLFTEVREQRGLAYYVFAANQGYTDSGTLYSQAGVDLKRIDEAVTTIVDELRKIAAEPVPPDELEKARSYAKGRFVLSLESPQGTNMFGLRREVLEGKATEPSEVLAELDKVTAEDVLRVGQDLMREEAFRLAVIGPFDDADRFRKLLDAGSL
ncbi:MAG TPA: pitrilysin family protein [Gaiellaceae bacterium]|nr:pitrilysin family protein [Gaiellaceae bacterium]